LFPVFFFILLPAFIKKLLVSYMNSMSSNKHTVASSPTCPSKQSTLHLTLSSCTGETLDSCGEQRGSGEQKEKKVAGQIQEKKTTEVKKTETGVPTLDGTLTLGGTPTFGGTPTSDSEMEALFQEDELYLAFQKKITGYILQENPKISSLDLRLKTDEMWMGMSEVERQEIFVRQTFL
jgi:hypothetical protein